MAHGSRRLPPTPTLLHPGPLADGDLLAWFVGSRDEVAFELLVRRHAPMVLAVCRRVLADANDADDAFQATFLVFARKADAVRRGEVLPAWLHRVASRAALRIRADRAHRAAREEPGAEHLPAPPVDPGLRELARVLDEEIAKLPRRYRAAFILCCLEGKTGEEAARLLGCPPGTVSSRLTRAREHLRTRLTRRGFAPALVPAALAGLADGVGAAPALSTAIDSTLRAAPDFAAGRPSLAPPTTRPAAVAEGVIRTMTTTKLKALTLLLVVGLLAFGGVLVATDRDKGGEANQPPPKAKAGENPPPTPVVQLVQPQPGGLERVTTLAGAAEAFEQADLLPLVAGSLKRVEVDIGDRVKRDQLVAEIDAPALVLDERLAAVGVDQAQGQLLEAEARVAAAQAEVAAAKGVVKQRESEVPAAKANLVIRKRQYDLIKSAVEKGNGSLGDLHDPAQHLHAAEAQVEGAAAALENAKADTEVKQRKVLVAEAGVKAAKPNVEAAKLALEKARLAIAQTKVLAPFDGVVTRRNRSPGDYVLPGERGAERGLFTLMRVDVVRVVASVAEQDIPLIEVGVPAEVTFPALPGVSVSGKVARTAFAVNPTNSTMRVEIDVPNAKGAIRPGMFGRVTLKLGKGPADALRVPVTALVPPPGAFDRTKVAVYIYRDGKARLTPVLVGSRNDREAEILSGVRAEDRIVANPGRLGRGDEVPVEVEKAAPPK